MRLRGWRGLGVVCPHKPYRSSSNRLFCRSKYHSRYEWDEIQTPYPRYNDAATMHTSCQVNWPSGVGLPLARCPGHGRGTGPGWHTRPLGFGKALPDTRSLRRSGCSWQGRWSKCPGSFSHTAGPPLTGSSSTAPPQGILDIRKLEQ